jgi:hypothetical protein
MGTLLDESLQLPPIDLTQTGESVESVAVMVMIPVARHAMARRLEQLNSVLRAGPLRLRAAAVGAVARRLPAEALMTLTRRWQISSTPPVQVKSLLDAAWSELLSGTKMIWYARRRNVPHKSSFVGQAVPEAEDHDGEQAFKELVKMLRDAGLYDEFTALPTRASAVAIAEAFTLLKPLAVEATRWQFAGLASTMLRLEQFRHKEYMASLNRFPVRVKQGLQRLEADASLKTVPMDKLGAANRMAELGGYVEPMSAAQYATFVAQLKSLLDSGLSLDEAFLRLRS